MKGPEMTAGCRWCGVSLTERETPGHERRCFFDPDVERKRTMKKRPKKRKKKSVFLVPCTRYETSSRVLYVRASSKEEAVEKTELLLDEDYDPEGWGVGEVDRDEADADYVEDVADRFDGPTDDELHEENKKQDSA